MGVAIYGNYGEPILAFPTSCGDEWEMEGQSMIRTLSFYLEQGRIRIFLGFKSNEPMLMPGVAQPAIQEGRYVVRLIRYRVAGTKPPGPF